MDAGFAPAALGGRTGAPAAAEGGASAALTVAPLTPDPVRDLLPAGWGALRAMPPPPLPVPAAAAAAPRGVKEEAEVPNGLPPLALALEIASDGTGPKGLEEEDDDEDAAAGCDDTEEPKLSQLPASAGGAEGATAAAGADAGTRISSRSLGLSSSSTSDMRPPFALPLLLSALPLLPEPDFPPPNKPFNFDATPPDAAAAAAPPAATPVAAALLLEDWSEDDNDVICLVGTAAGAAAEDAAGEGPRAAVAEGAAAGAGLAAAAAAVMEAGSGAVSKGLGTPGGSLEALLAAADAAPSSMPVAR